MVLSRFYHGFPRVFHSFAAGKGAAEPRKRFKKCRSPFILPLGLLPHVCYETGVEAPVLGGHGHVSHPK